MATLKPYFSDVAAPGSKTFIWAQFGAFWHVGSGSFGGFSDFEVQYHGRVDCVLYHGNLNLTLKLPDQKPDAVSGPVEFSINGAHAERANYLVEGDVLIVEAFFSNQTAEVVRLQRSADGRESYLSLSGVYGANVHLAPA